MDIFGGLKMRFTLTRKEEYIQKLYIMANIHSPELINDYNMADMLSITLMPAPIDSKRLGSLIVIDNRIPDEEQHEQFAHELCHSIWHVTNQMLMPDFWTEYQEWTADTFANHYCMPTFMLLDLDLQAYRTKKHLYYEMAELFGVTLEFATKRIDDFLFQLEWRDKNIFETVHT